MASFQAVTTPSRNRSPPGRVSLPERNSGAIAPKSRARKRMVSAPRNALAYCFVGATIFITNEVGASPGSNGPGTLLLTGGRLLR